MARRDIAVDSIQGNVFGGFNKDHQRFLLLRFRNAKGARAWIKELVDDKRISPSSEVLKFNNQFKALLAEGVAKPETLIQAIWVNLAISFRGLQALDLKAGDLRKFPTAFKDGMKKRAARLGDAGASDPQSWLPPYGSPDLHALLILAADDPDDLTRRVEDITGTPAFRGGVEVLGTEDGNTRADQPGHEHFGFKDGVSQPGIRGLTPPDDPIGNPNQGHPGQDLLWPGEFVLGYPTQKPKAKRGFDGPNPDPGKPSRSGPAWTADGSYLVFRRLGQDVPGFRKQVQDLATQLKSHPDLVGAKLVGRYASGCPLEERAFQPAPFAPSPTDPGDPKKGGNAALADSDSLNNNFEFGDDADGAICPLGAHIRKAYPRDEPTPPISKDDSESATQTHRLLRRGIPFGSSLGAPQGGGANDPRGLLFLAYQNDIESHFEFVQSQWVNERTFPAFPKGLQPGEDPVIAQSHRGPFQIDPKNPKPISVQHFVTTNGGEYFFAPSLDALEGIGANRI